MFGKSNEQPFGELPEALVGEMLTQCDTLGSNLSDSFKKLYDYKTEMRNKLSEKKLLKKDADLSFVPSNPTTCAVDGSYAIERLICTDLVAIAGVAVEGLTPPSEKNIGLFHIIFPKFSQFHIMIVQDLLQEQL